VTKVASLEIEINRHTKQLEAAVTDLDGTDMFLGHDWLVKHNPEVNWKNGTIRFTRCPGHCTIKHEDIRFNTRRQMAMDKMEQDNVSQTSFSLYLHNQWTDFHKLSCAGKPQMRAICICVGCTKVTTND